MKSKDGNKKKAGSRRRARTRSKLIYFALVGVLVGAVALIAGFSGADNNPTPEVIPGGTLSVTDDFYDFGRVSMEDGNVYHSFRLKNEGKERALVRKLYTS